MSFLPAPWESGTGAETSAALHSSKQQARSVNMHSDHRTSGIIPEAARVKPTVSLNQQMAGQGGLR